MSEKELIPAQHEPTDVGESYAWITTVLLVVAVIAFALLVLLLYPGVLTDRRLHLPLPSVPSPQLQTSSRDDFAKFHSEEMRRLNGAGWIDRQRGVAHIPIADAMRHVAQQGIPGWPTPAESPP
jgi:hypothetical protein